MKTKHLVILILIIMMGRGLFGGNTPGSIQVVSSKSGKIELRLESPKPEMTTTTVGNQKFTNISMEGSATTADDGKPALPIFTATIAIPPTGDYSVSVKTGKYKEYQNVTPLPVFATEEMATSLSYDRAGYSSDMIYPSRLVEYTQPSIIRDFRVIQLTLLPVQWNAGSKELRVYDDMEVTVSFNGNSSENELGAYTGYSKSFESIYESIIANFDQYRDDAQITKNPRILLIYGNSTDTSFLQQLNAFVNWKRQKGYEVNLASTQVAGSSNTAIKTYIQGQYNNPATRPDFIVLVGDTNGSYAIPTWTETLSNYSGKGDYPYTHLAGGDLLGDVFIGRISAENLSQLSILFSKIYAYEKNINNDETAAAWLNRMMLVGDPTSSGISTQYVNKFIKELALETNPDYTFIENYSGGFPSTMNQAVNTGIGFFNYRGYIGMSGWSPSSSYVNGARMPHATILTCGTGNFENDTATTEAFMRLGTSVSPAGAITACGMSTSGTHTMYNNCLNGGIYDGLFTHKMRTMGEAVLNAKLYLYNTYAATNVTQANYFSHWCNLMGDPTVEVFVGIPGSLTLNASPTIVAGSLIYDTQVVDANGLPVQNVSVTIFAEGTSQIVSKGFTDANGNLTLAIPGTLSGSLIVTASKHNFKPVQLNVSVDAAGSLVYFDKAINDDGTSGSSGNNDGFANAGETIALWVNIENTTQATISGINAVLSTTDPQITITQANSAYPSLEPTGLGLNTTAFNFTIGNNVSAAHDTRFVLTLTDGSGNNYSTYFHFGSINASLEFYQYNLNAGGNAILDPAENGVIQISLINNSPFGVNNVQAELRSLNDLLVVTDSLSTYGNFLPNATTGSIDGFGLFARPLLIPGMQIPMRMRLFNNEGFEQLVSFNLPIGTVSQNTPLGPDAYGYFIYDMSDTSYPDCPTYDWIEIVPANGGSGTQITGLNDSGYSGDEGDQNDAVSLAVMDLPFSFRFYGLDYTQITVCVNGFIAMGASANGEFRNYRLPGAMGPSPMIAPFWDDLILINDAGIYKWYNAAEHYFVVSYNKMRNGYNRTSEETFQVIFYDPLFYPTGLGDGMIKIQYKTFNNVDVGGGGYSPLHGNYSTIGIKDHTNSRGLEYTYNNVYPTAAAPLANFKSLMITTEPVLHQNAHIVVGELIVTDSSGNDIVEPGDRVELGIKLNNLGINSATNVHIVGAVMNPYVTPINLESDYSTIAGSSFGINIDPLILDVSELCPNDQVVSVMINVTIDGNSWQYPVNFVVRKPSLSVEDIFMNDAAGNGNGMAEPGESFKLIVNYKNTTDVPAMNITSNINCLDANVTIGNAQMLINEIPAQTTVQAVYDMTFNNNVQIGSYVTVYLTYLGDLIAAQNKQLMVSVGTTGMSSDFEENNGSFVPTPTTNGWEWGTSSYAGSHSGTKVWGTRLNSEYPNNASYSLVSPSVFIGSNFALEFWHRYNFEDYYDGGNVKISTNNGSSWTLLTPEGGYPEDNIAAMNEAGYSASQTTWTQARFNLSAFANQTVKFKWTMGSDQGVTGQGWFIDDVKTTGFIGFAGCASGIVTTSNPATDLQTIKIRSSSGFLTTPNENGDFSLYLPVGNHSLSATAPGYQTIQSPTFPMSIISPTYAYNFELGYYSPVTDLSFTVSDDQLQLNWTAPVEPLYPVLGYNVFRKINAGRFELLEMITTPGYAQTLTEIGTYHYYVQAVYETGASVPTQTVTFEYPYSDGDDPTSPYVTRLEGNYPNPFNPETTFRFSIKDAGNARLDIFNLRGQLVRTLVNGNLNAGQHQVVWNGKDQAGRSVSSGVYLYRLTAKNYSSTKKAMLVK